MLPCLPLPQIGNCWSANSVLSGHFGVASFVNPYISNVLLSQLRPDRSFSKNGFMATPIHHVLCVLVSGSRDDVSGVHTRGVVARMPHHNTLSAALALCLSVCKFVRDAMRCALLTVPAVSSVSGSLVLRSKPVPTLSGTTNVNIAPEICWLASSICISAMSVAVVLLDNIRRYLKLLLAAPCTENRNPWRIFSHGVCPALMFALTRHSPAQPQLHRPSSIRGPAGSGALGADCWSRNRLPGA